MKNPVISIFIFLLSFYFSSAIAQENYSGEESMGFEEANKVYKNAKKLWNEEKFNEAEKLFYEANNQHPSVFLNQLAFLKFDMGDIKGANKAYDDCITKLSGGIKNSSYTKSQLREMLCNTYWAKIDKNSTKGDPREAVLTAVKFLKNAPEGHRNIFGMHYPEVKGILLSAINIAFQIEDLHSLSEFESLLTTYEKSRQPLLYASVYKKVLEKRFDEAEKQALEGEDNAGGIGFNSKMLVRYLLAIIHSYKGDFAKSQQWINKSKKSIFIGEDFFIKINGINALAEKKYDEAITYFNSALNHKRTSYFSVNQLGKFNTYTFRAQAHEGLGDFINAKKDYEAALVYHAEYEPALTGLARLEGRVISERRSDKLPPEIIITEPASLTRGLKITGNGTDMMIKGIAKDSFGLKSVSINGTSVFSKEQGDFWGNVSLKPGLNSVTIEAVDMAGNKASKTIEIEQPAAPVAVKDDEIIAVTEKEGKNYALFIASQNYDDASIPSLENPIADAVKLKLILKKNYGFKDDNIISLYNPEKNNFRQQFQQLSEMLQPEDNLIIFYAGHGIWVEKEKKGYWLLTDAKRNDTESWVSNKDVLDMIAKLPTRHTLLITDACFSGGVFKTRSIGKDAPAAMVSMNEKISRVAITSGNDTEVPDESVFMKYLVKALSENKDKYFTAQKMFINHIIEAVMTETKTEPRYGTLELAGHVGGDFIFIKK